jgi:hypothetical protein
MSTSRAILMGQTAVISKAEAVTKNIKFLKSPSAETCVILVLSSPKGMGLAHFDTSLYADEAIINMIRKFKNMGEKPEDIKATLVGGDTGPCLSNSSTIYNSINKALEKAGVPKVNITHNHSSYTVPYLLLPVGYLALRAIDLVGPESNWAAAAFALALFGATVALNSSILEKTFDVEVNISNDQVIATPSNKANVKRIIGEGATVEQVQSFFQRNKLNPCELDPAKRPALQYKVITL